MQPISQAKDMTPEHEIMKELEPLQALRQSIEDRITKVCETLHDLEQQREAVSIKCAHLQRDLYVIYAERGDYDGQVKRKS